MAVRCGEKTTASRYATIFGELLPERERVVIELAYWSGLSQTEIASYLDVPLGTVKKRERGPGLARLAGLLEEVRG